jgi:hypothetical protein
MMSPEKCCQKQYCSIYSFGLVTSSLALGKNLSPLEEGAAGLLDIFYRGITA